jgi:hypothetical protein
MSDYLKSQVDPSVNNTISKEIFKFPICNLHFSYIRIFCVFKQLRKLTKQQTSPSSDAVLVIKECPKGLA